MESGAVSWVTVSAENIAKMSYSSENNSHLEQNLANILQLKNFKYDLNDACIVDFFVTVSSWCKENALTTEQASYAIDISRRLLADIKQKSSSVVESIRELKVALSDVITNSTNEEPGLPIEKIGDFVKFMNNMLIQHHKLWEFFFHRLHEETVICKDLTLETAPSASIPWPPPLFEGCPESLYKTYLSPQTTSAVEPSSTDAPNTQGQSANRESSATTLVTSGSPAPSKTRDGTKSPTRQRKPTTSPHRKIPSNEDELRQSAEKVLATLDKDTIRSVVEKTGRDITSSAEAEILSKIRERENAITTKINQVHKVATDSN